MKVKLTNMQATAQRFLFDKPKGNNQTHLEITDINGTSVLHAYWRELSSHMWLEEELDPFYYLLQPNHSIVREFYLEEIAVIRNPDIEGGLNSMLKDGIYTLRIKFGKNYSNIQKFTIQKKSKGN